MPASKIRVTRVPAKKVPTISRPRPSRKEKIAQARNLPPRATSQTATVKKRDRRHRQAPATINRTPKARRTVIARAAASAATARSRKNLAPAGQARRPRPTKVEKPLPTNRAKNRPINRAATVNPKSRRAKPEKAGPRLETRLATRRSIQAGQWRRPKLGQTGFQPKPDHHSLWNQRQGWPWSRRRERCGQCRVRATTRHCRAG